MSFPDGNDKPKYVIVICEWDVPTHQTGGQAAIVVANTDKHPGAAKPPYRVQLTVPQGCFTHPTTVDGRWVYTIQMKKLMGAAYQFALSPADMTRVDAAIRSGLGL